MTIDVQRLGEEYAESIVAMRGALNDGLGDGHMDLGPLSSETAAARVIQALARRGWLLERTP